MKKKIALVTGGFSGESVISYQSAQNIYNALDGGNYEVYLVDINNEGWFCEVDGKRSAVNRDDFSVTHAGNTIRFDLAYIAMHGTPGEDGKLQGYFDMLKIPYTSCDAATSAITFNKRYTTAVAGMSGIKVARSVLFIKEYYQDASPVMEKGLQYPLFVKPNNGGSSIGMSKVSAAEELPAAIEKAFKEDNQVLVEEMITGREFTVGVFRSLEGIEVLPITEIQSQKDFFDFEAKYQGRSQEITPAQIDEAWKQNMEAAAAEVYSLFNCKGVVRIDFIYNEAEGAPYMLEINTIPGQTNASVIPQQVRARGWDLREFYAAIVEEALKSS